MPDEPHPDLAGLTAAPLEPHERMTAAAARFRRMARVPGIPQPAARPLATWAAALEFAARTHAAEGCVTEEAGLGPCIPQLITAAILGEEGPC